jgi:predicted dehydrogenase
LVKLGLVGAGRWGRNYIKTISTLDGVCLTRLASRNPESQSLVDANCEITTNWQSLISAGDLDGVIVATPPDLHAEMALAAISARLPVLVEKPLTLNLAQAEKLLKQSIEQGVLIMVEHTHLFHPAFEALCMKSAFLGPILAIRAEASNHGPYRSDVSVLWDWGAHDIAMCIALTGTSPRARSATCYESCNVEGGIGESIHLELEWPDGMIADIRLSNISVRRRRFTVFFEGGVLVYDDMANNKLVMHPAQHFEEQLRGLGRALPFANCFPLTRAVASFVGSIKSKAISHDSLALGVDVTRVLAECERLVKL